MTSSAVGSSFLAKKISLGKKEVYHMYTPILLFTHTNTTVSCSMCCYNSGCCLQTLATLLLESCLPLFLCCHLLLCCVMIFLLEILLFVMFNNIDANPQSGPEDQ